MPRQSWSQGVAIDEKCDFGHFWPKPPKVRGVFGDGTTCVYAKGKGLLAWLAKSVPKGGGAIILGGIICGEDLSLLIGILLRLGPIGSFSRQ